jgi:hypothetical protein
MTQGEQPVLIFLRQREFHRVGSIVLLGRTLHWPGSSFGLNEYSGVHITQHEHVIDPIRLIVVEAQARSAIVRVAPRAE